MLAGRSFGMRVSRRCAGWADGSRGRLGLHGGENRKPVQAGSVILVFFLVLIQLVLISAIRVTASREENGHANTAVVDQLN